MRNLTLLLCGALFAAGCDQAEAPHANAANALANAAAAKAPKRYCFFRKEDSKGWAASRDAKGNVRVTGRAHVRDTRYKGDLGQPEVSGSTAKLWLTMAPNTGQYRSADDWWDVSFTIPDSGAIESVTVACDSKRVLAELKVKR